MFDDDSHICGACRSTDCYCVICEACDWARDECECAWEDELREIEVDEPETVRAA